MSTFVAFYAYKGGTGRSVALLHTAWALAREGRRVVLLDLDLSAPSLWPLLRADPPQPGFIELAAEWAEGKTPHVYDFVHEVPLDSRADGALYLLGAGRMDERYLEALGALDWQMLLEARRYSGSTDQQGLFGPRGSFFQYLRQELDERIDPDIVFIDAPTGLSDTANVCLRVLADVVTVIFNPTAVQLEGVGRVVSLLTSEQHTLRDQRSTPRDVYCVASTLMARRLGGTELKRITRGFEFLNRVRFEALGRPDLESEETAELVEQPAAIVSYSPSLADLDRVDTTHPVDEGVFSVYEDILKYLRQCAPLRRRGAPGPRLSASDKKAVLSALEPVLEQFADREAEKLEPYFLRNVHVDKLDDPVTVVVLGGKGAGKTALFTYASRRKLEHVEHRAMHGAGSGGLGPDALVEIERGGASMDVFWRVYALAQSGWAIDAFPDTVQNAVLGVRGLQSNTLGLEAVQRALGVSTLSVDVDRAWSSIERQLADSQSSLVLYLDGLDTAFKTDLDQRRRSLAALFVGWQATFAKLERAKLKVFLRTDLWEQLSFPEKSHLGIRTAKLQWSKDDLWRVVLKRALSASEFSTLGVAWNITPRIDAAMVEASATAALVGYLDLLFEQRIWKGKNSLARNWILRRLADARDTIFPRDILTLFSEAVREERRRLQEEHRVATDAVLSRESLSSALAPTSRQRVDALREEYPELIDVLESLQGLPAKGRSSDLRSHFATRRFPDAEPLDVLEKAGVVGISGEEYEVPALYLHGLNMVRPGPT